jgi:hypothetical protein
MQPNNGSERLGSSGSLASLADLPERLLALPADARARVEDMFELGISTGMIDPPSEMYPWIRERFGSTEVVREQTVTRTLNRWTLEGASFNNLRARRPIPVAQRQPAGDPTGDPFCDPHRGTPADGFGRIQGAHSVTASNIAKYDGLNSMVILDTHDALDWSEAQLVDAFRTARRWHDAAHAEDPAAVYPLVTWNCLPRSGASLMHPHLNVALGRTPYAKIEQWRRAANTYGQEHGRRYFEDFIAVHESLGLAGSGSNGARWVAHLTPVKENEVVLVAARLNDASVRHIYKILSVLRDEIGVRAFNLAVYLPPMAPVEEVWDGFPAVVRIVDRGNPDSATSDIGAMELFAQPVVSSDPWALAARLRAAGC